MKVFVTGGAGFIGTHLCRQLVRSGHEVVSLDLRDPQVAVPGVRYHRGDVIDSDVVPEMIAVADAVVHLAALVSVPLCRVETERGYASNLACTVRILECLRRRREQGLRTPRLIFSGSSVVYGGRTALGETCHEDAELAMPKSLYGAQKLACEHAIRIFAEDYGVPAVVFRFFNVYGVGQDASSPYSGVVTAFASAIARGGQLRLDGGGVHTRDFVSVLDIARACELALTVEESRCDGRPINLGTGRAVAIRELADIMIRLGGRRVDVMGAPPRPGDVPHSRADVSRAWDVLGWMPRVTLERGLAELLAQDVAPRPRASRAKALPPKVDPRVASAVAMKSRTRRRTPALAGV